ncbi:proton channel OTOP2-like isoform X2 [Rhinatrema bivittatum]|uniref:proton channel OTOP2-like isoform X2 n=1 Tax=Rhinatrema bivittatum TaxID=194408 RepID=UPI0011287007|nr:proton channel OTOP2-like isoform X2 [Rhinatrema bivittatum]
MGRSRTPPAALPLKPEKKGRDCLSTPFTHKLSPVYAGGSDWEQESRAPGLFGFTVAEAVLGFDRTMSEGSVRRHSKTKCQMPEINTILRDDQMNLWDSLRQTELLGLQEESSMYPNQPENWKKGGRLISLIVSSNIILLGCTLLCCDSLKDVAIHDTEVQLFLSVLMLLSILWMFFQIYFTSRHQNAVLYKDSHAGPIWMKGGLVLFGMFTLVLDALKIGYYAGFNSCVSPMKLIFPLVEAAFVITQIYFLWVSCKHCIQIHHDLTRCGLMLVLTTNLALWMTAVTDESSHQASELEKELHENDTMNETLEFRESDSDGCQCNSVCQVFQRGYYYLYPLNIEYNLFAAPMVYIMWKNVGRLIDDNAFHHYSLNLKLCKHRSFIGLILGLIMLVLGIVLFTIYEMKKYTAYEKSQALVMFYIFHIVCLGVMSLGALAGSIIYRFDERVMDNRKNPSRTLDVALLLTASLGQYCISYFSIVAMVVIKPEKLLNILTLTYSLLMIVQHSIQNIFIIEGLHRQPPEDSHHGHKSSTQSKKENPVELICVRDSFSSHTLKSNLSSSTTVTDEKPAAIQKELKGTTNNMHLTINLKRRKILKEIYLFLLLGNILFWIMPAFGARIRFDNGLEVNFYGFSIWVIITNICLPFGIFYRMHAAASLLELYTVS